MNTRRPNSDNPTPADSVADVVAAAPYRFRRPISELMKRPSASPPIIGKQRIDRPGVLAIDVDGPLNPYAAKPHKRPAGYETWRYTDHGDWYGGKDAHRHKDMRVWLNPGHGQMLLDLSRHIEYELTWLTTWADEANRLIGPATGLPELPVIPIAPGGRWKWPGVADYAAGRLLVWIDDDHDHADYRAGRSFFDRSRHGLPTLLCHVDPAIGLQRRHIDEIWTWADSLPDKRKTIV